MEFLFIHAWLSICLSDRLSNWLSDWLSVSYLMLPNLTNQFIKLYEILTFLYKLTSIKKSPM